MYISSVSITRSSMLLRVTVNDLDVANTAIIDRHVLQIFENFLQKRVLVRTTE